MKLQGNKANAIVLSFVIFPLLFASILLLPHQVEGEESILLGIFSAYPGADEISGASDALLTVFRGISGGSVEGDVRALAFTTNDALNKVVKYYRDNPPDRKWEMVLELGSEEKSYIALWKRNDETAQLVIGSGNGETTILMGYGKQEAVNERSWKSFTEEDGLVEDTATVIVKGEDGSIWAGTLEGLLKYANSTWESFTDGPLNHGVADLEVSSDGVLWIATLYGGVVRYDGSSWIKFTEKDGLVNDKVSSIALGNDGKVWASSYDRKGGLSVYNGSTWANFTEGNGMPSNCVHSVSVGSMGDVWAGTKKGLVHLTSKGMEIITKKDGLIGDEIEEVNFDGTGNLWVITDKGVSRYDGSYWINYPDDEIFPATDVLRTSIGPEGGIWFGTRQGISVFDGDSWNNYTEEDGLPDEYIISVLATSTGAIWAGTISDGIWSGRLK